MNLDDVFESLLEDEDTLATQDDLTIFLAIKSYRLASLRDPHYAASIVSIFKLEPFYDYLLDFNAGNNLPYHNFYHARCMLLNCYEGAYHERLLHHDPTRSVMRGLLVAALLHDFNHSGGRLKDDAENITLALEGLKMAQLYAVSKFSQLTAQELEVAVRCIKCTKYPYEGEPGSLEEQIIRDADLMQPYEERAAELKRQFNGLKAEVQLQRGVTYSDQAWSEGLKKFYDETTWHTKWAQSKASALHWGEITARLARIML